ncbi:PKD-like family lipoprotein [Sphingobacterium bambusae]|uniref:PKD-like family lipoprotein n=1 Tax=Sphingobacterium bambusae TaxID=662858 RepID=A0ABW6BJN6_9SPHI|nr:PKD-like family lipoprotein [Sphingobacterium bambusae]WPL49458.1 PKD-like family lipoprotein [Sphingobacterium bambusae]
MKILIIKLVACCLIFISAASCFKDKGNYDYSSLGDTVQIALSSTVYNVVLNESVLHIEPSIVYSGNESDLSYEWQIWSKDEFKYIPMQQGKVLNYQVGGNAIMPTAAAYNIRLAVENKNRARDEKNMDANRQYSRIITVVAESSREYLGLMVLHGDGTSSDVGIIDHPLFAKTSMTFAGNEIISNLYSSFNGGNRIRGRGIKVTRVGQREDFGTYTVGSSNVYIITDQVGLRTKYENLENTNLSYSALMTNPSDASGKLQAFERMGALTSNPGVALIDEGRLFYGLMYGPMVGNNFSYHAAPFVQLIRKGSVGFIAFDQLSRSFIYSAPSTSSFLLNKFPSSESTTQNFSLTDTKADLLHLELRTVNSSTIAVMKGAGADEFFLLDLNLYTNELGKVLQGKYSLSTLPEINAIRFYAFGGGANVNYCASNNKLYRFSYVNGITANQITDYGNEEITMMKIVKYENPEGSGMNPTDNYQYSNSLLIVSTKNPQGAGKIYAYRYDINNGALLTPTIFAGDGTVGKTFGEIYDVDIKTAAVKVSSGGGWGGGW